MLYQNTWRSDVIPTYMEECCYTKIHGGVMLYQNTWKSDVIPKYMEE